MMANLLLLLLRFISAIFMLQGLAYLQRRMKEKERKVERQLLRGKRLRERKKNELMGQIEKKKRELRQAQLEERKNLDQLEVDMEEKLIEDRERARRQLLLFNV